MSQAKFAAARELIQEKNYDAARAVLKTINDPSAGQWLYKLDQIAPEMPVIPLVVARSPEEDKFYRTQNRDRRRRRIAKGVQMIMMSAFVLIIYGVFTLSEIQNNGEKTLGVFDCLLPLGTLMLITGLIFIFKE